LLNMMISSPTHCTALTWFHSSWLNNILLYVYTLRCCELCLYKHGYKVLDSILKEVSFVFSPEFLYGSGFVVGSC
jgi:hypothetical protein